MARSMLRFLPLFIGPLFVPVLLGATYAIAISLLRTAHSRGALVAALGGWAIASTSWCLLINNGRLGGLPLLANLVVVALSFAIPFTSAYAALLWSTAKSFSPLVTWIASLLAGVVTLPVAVILVLALSAALQALGVPLIDDAWP